MDTNEHECAIKSEFRNPKSETGARLAFEMALGRVPAYELMRGEYFGAEWIDLRSVQFTPDLLRLMPGSVARRFRVLPISEDSSMSLVIAVADPRDIDTIDSVCHLLDRHLSLRVAEPEQLEEFVELLYGDARM